MIMDYWGVGYAFYCVGGLQQLIVEMGKKNFDRKKAVRFHLVPGPEKDGKPTVLFKPAENKKSKLSKKERKQAISLLADYEEITINGKVVDEDELPAFVLEQIRGRNDLIFNQMNPQREEEEQEEGDLYELQDARNESDNEYEEYEDEPHEKIEEEDEGDWEDEDEADEDDGDFQEHQILEEEEIQAAKGGKYEVKEDEFPALQPTEKVTIEGKEYYLTKQQLGMLDTVIPANYEQMDFGGLNFKRYNEEGLLISEKEKYDKYLLKDDEKVVVIDTYEYVPSKPVDFIDNDLKPSQITGNANVKELEDALDYEGEEEVYEELEDDFFAKLIQEELQDNLKPKEQKQQKQPKQKEVREVREVKEVKMSKPVVAKQVEKELDEQLETAMFNFEHNIEDSKAKPQEDSSSEEEEEKSHNNFSMNFSELEKREEYLGKDGELDWRMLTKKEKREYMKTKVIREYYDELREREIEEKMEGISNVKPEELHLKQLVKHITYQDDHVMQKALEEDLKKEVHLSDEEEEAYFETESDEDDIVSFHQKTSIIASNLSVIEEPRPQRKKKEDKQEVDEPEIKKVKVILDPVSREMTKQERQERKAKLKELKKERREQQKEFAQRFNKHKKESARRENPNNPLNKVSYVKIH